jgi:Dolichyl-phosphate-mannose-protein mannosyltransferase
VPDDAWLRRFAARHWMFGVVLMFAAALRAVVMLGYRPVEWFNDSYAYVTAAVNLIPETIRPSGYALLLAALEPLHRFAAVALSQHLLGLATGIGVYAVLRVRGVRAWIAALAALPVLFDGYEIQLEHLVMADTFFMFLVTAAVVALCLRNQPGWISAAAAGLLLGVSAIVRTDGRPLLVVAAVCLIIRRAGWRPVTALVAAGLLPVAAYMGWYHQARGRYAVTEGDGAFLYSRAMAFADCAKMNPPDRLRPLCDKRRPAKRPPSADYIWQWNPLRSAAGNPWAARPSKLASDFAILAVRKQPADYLRVAGLDVLRTFSWNRSTVFPDPATARQYQFASAMKRFPGWAPVADLRVYQPGRLTTRVIRPYSSFLVGYQRYLYFRGSLLALTLAAGAAWVVTGRRRGAPGLLPWCMAAALIAIPPATAGFAYRYVLAAVPCACIAAGMATVGARITRRAPQEQSPAEPVGAAEAADSHGTAGATAPTSAGAP